MAPSLSRALLLLSLPLLAAASEAEETFATATLQADECSGDAAEEGECALNAIQLRGKKVASEGDGEEAWQHPGLCSVYGCSEVYVRWHTCQCNEGCETHGNCCMDFTAKCSKPSSTPDGDAEGGSTGSAPASSSVAGHPSATKSYPEYPGFTLALVEEFDVPLDLDSDPIWTWSDGGLIEGQIRFAKEGIQFSGGKMIVQTSDTPAVGAQTCSHAEVANIKPKKMTSGELRTRHNMFRYGRYEVRMKAPMVQPGDDKVNGNYVSTMFVFRDAKYKHWREIDFEITGDSTGSITTNVLSADNTDKWRAGIQESKQLQAAFNTRSEFHTYAFEWLPDSITWYIDGKVVRKKTGGGVSIPQFSGKIMMNLWMFDDRALFGGPEIKNNRYPMHSEYDWFRFYKWDGDKTYPCPGFGTSCLTQDDKYLSSNNPCDGIPQVGTVYGKPPCHASCGR